MDSCLLCLEINKDTLDCITVNSEQWQEFDIEKTIEKYFWSLNTIGSSSCICLQCWREVDSFHKFYMRIEEAHMNFGTVKLEDTELDKGNSSFCFLQPEIVIDQEQQDFVEPDMIIDIHQSVNDEQIDELDLDNMPLHTVSKRLKLLQWESESRDPLEKYEKSKKKNVSTLKIKEEKSTQEKIENSKIKIEPDDLRESYLGSLSDDNNDALGVNYQTNEDSSETSEYKRRKGNNSQSNGKEYDKFIAEHFKEMFCALCEVPFKNFTDMHKHFNDTHKQRGYIVCCKRKFSERTRFVDHLHCHLNPDYFKCKECGKTMSDRAKFDTHMLLIHRANEVVKQHCCDVCGKSFRQAYLLRGHKLIHLPEEEKKFPCSDCGKNYGTASILKQHMQVVHLKRYVKVCYICGKEINSSVEFKAHMEKHEGQPVINCDICGLRLTTERGLKRHKDTQHPADGKKDHPCPICPKVSPTIKALRKHINTMHEKGYDYKCTICEKEFKRPEAHREHMASHTGTPLYTCPWCPKTFNSNGNMHAHRKKVHPKEWNEAKLEKYSGKVKINNDTTEQGHYI